MALSLHTIKPADGSKKSKKRIGRGLASRGAKSGRGQKGQKSRAGSGGLQRIGIRQQMLAMPKLRGFKSPHADKAVVNVADIQATFAKGDIVTPATLAAKKLVAAKAKKDGVKILGNGEIEISVTVKKCAVSKSAAEKIMKAGGSIEA